VLEPIPEADGEDGAYGYRPGRSAADAIKGVHRLICRGETDVVIIPTLLFRSHPFSFEW
jgi:RNA-directed DNA polymerase